MMAFKALVSERINQEINWPFSVLTILAVILLRNFLENLSSPFYQGNFFPGFFMFLSSPLFYFSIFFSLVLLVYYLARLEFKQAFNFAVLFCPVMLLPPLIDLAVTGGRGASMVYLFFDNWSALATSLAAFYGKFIEPGITLGIRAEVALIMIGIGYFVYSRTGSLKRSIGGGISVYLIIFFFNAFPSIIAHLFGNVSDFKSATLTDGMAVTMALKDLFSKSLVSSIHFLQELPKEPALLYNQQFHILISRIGWLIILCQCSWLFYLGNRRVFEVWKKNLRWERTLYYMAIGTLGIILGWHAWAQSPSFNAVDILGLIVFFVLIALSFWLAIGINDLFDLKTDKLSNASRPLVKGTISPKEQIFLNLLLFVFIITGASTINYLVLILLLLFHATSFIYSTYPLRFKKILGLSSLLVGLGGLFVAMAGFYFVAPIQKLSFFPKYILAMILLGFALAANIKDIRDYEGDKADGIKTIPVVFGFERGKKIIGILAASALIIVALLTKFRSITIASLIFSVIFFLLIVRKDYKEKPIFIAFLFYLVICLILLVLS